MILNLPIALLGSHLVLVAEQVPHFNVDPGCRAAAIAAVAPNRTPDSCKHDENEARSKVEQEWSQFNSADKSRCVTLSGLGGAPSYVELLTCLEMAKAAKTLPAGDKLEGKIR
ncbi:MAG TPA: hypothetical protein VFX37_02785 [Pseudolabrys sp.]|nr:hypothetical protein [Pseudolabrys sp.]